MPHPEHAVDPLLGSTDGALILGSLVDAARLSARGIRLGVASQARAPRRAPASWRAPRAGARRHARAVSPARGARRRPSRTRTGSSARRARPRAARRPTRSASRLPAAARPAARRASPAPMESLSSSWNDRSGAGATRGIPLCHECVKSTVGKVCRPTGASNQYRWDTSPASPCSRRSPSCSPRRPASARRPPTPPPASSTGSPTTPGCRAAPARSPRDSRACTQLGVKVVRFTLNWNLIAPAKPDAPTDPEDASYDWSKVDPVLDGLHSRGMTVVHAAERRTDLGERRPAGELRPHVGDDVPRLRDRRRDALLVGQALADLERAEPGALAAADERVGLHDTPAQSRLPRDPPRDLRRAGCGRRHGASRLDRRRLSRGVADRHARGARAARRVRAQPLSARPEAREPVSRRLRELHDDHDGDDQQARLARRAELPARADLADRVRLSDQSARPTCSACHRRCRRATSARPRTSRTARRASTC